MVAFVDVMEGRGLVERRTHAGDRRKNVVVLTTPAGTLSNARPRRPSAEQRSWRADETRRPAAEIDLLAVIQS